MKTNLKEFNYQNKIIRAIICNPSNSNKKLYLMLPGFGRSGVSEKKFKKLSELLVTSNFSTLRIDFLGSGISDGEFRFTTVDELTKQIIFILQKLHEEGYEVQGIISHSLAGCVVANLIYLGYKFNKILLLAPALNQKNLQRYWFTQKMIKPQKIEINYSNYLDYFNEELFIKDMNLDGKMTKNDFINKEYFLENMNKDYSHYLQEVGEDSVLMIHGLKDEAVPYESQLFKPKNLILVEKGDHDLERPDLFRIWIENAMIFLNS